LEKEYYNTVKYFRMAGRYDHILETEKQSVDYGHKGADLSTDIVDLVDSDDDNNDDDASINTTNGVILSDFMLPDDLKHFQSATVPKQTHPRKFRQTTKPKKRDNTIKSRAIQKGTIDSNGESNRAMPNEKINLTQNLPVRSNKVDGNGITSNNVAVSKAAAEKGCGEYQRGQ
jgi:hypothetical protein